MFRLTGLIVCCLLPTAVFTQEKGAQRGGEERAAVLSTRKTIVVPVRHGDPGAIAKTLLTILGADGDKSRPYVVMVDAATRSLIVSGDAAGIEAVQGLIQTLDVPPSVTRGVRRFRLKASVNSVASALEQTMRQLFPERGQADRPGLIAEASSNSLLVTGTENDLQLVAQLVTELDMVAVKRATRMFMEVYRVDCPRDKIDAIEVDSFAPKAVTVKELATALGQWGKTQVLYRADQIIDLNGKTQLKLGCQSPSVASKSTPKGGPAISSVQYKDVGCTLAIEGGWTDASAGIGEAMFDMDISTVTESDVSVSEDVKAPIFRSIRQDFKGAIKSGRPILLLNIDSSGTLEHVPVMVTRIVLTQLQ